MPTRASKSLAFAAVTALLAATTPVTVAAAAGEPARIEDDYARALAVAKERNVPLIVDVWAPW